MYAYLDKCPYRRQAARDGKTFPGFLAGGDPARGSVGGVLPEFLQHAQLAACTGERS